ncbi:MAG: hypothetical protein JNL80_17085 [Phycisphaerae bacterium]|nr:hypothetical protein [Phycisphaerae bacterium]
MRNAATRKADRSPDGEAGGEPAERSRRTSELPPCRPHLGRSCLTIVGTLRFLFLALAMLLTLPQAALGQEIKYELRNFGVGNAARPGDGIAVRVAVVSTSTEVKTVEIVWVVPNADGDPIEYSRIVNVAPNGRVERWIYGRLPPNSSPAQVVTQAAYQVRLYEVDAKHNRIADLYSQPMSGADAETASFPIDQLADLALVIGDSRLGLEGYDGGAGLAGAGVPPSLNSILATIDGATPDSICDDWKGLSPYSMIFWCDGRHGPGKLDNVQVEAIREWIRRGNTLVIGLAADLAADAWGIGKADPPALSDLLPSVAPTRHEGVPLSLIEELISKTPLRESRATTRLYSFDPKQLDRGYRPLVAIPARKDASTGYAVREPNATNPANALAGAVVGVQRNYGHGQVIVLGIDVDGINQRNLPGGSFPQADVFWNPILGRRGDTLNSIQRQELEESQRIAAIQYTSSLGSGSTMSEYIGMQSKAGAAVLGAAALFIFYWLFSGPLGFLALKQFKRQRHSWMLFVVFAFVFTAVAWIGGVVLGSTTPSIKHLTIIDQLAVDPSQSDPSSGVPPQRAVCYFSAYLPNYNEKLITVGGDNPNNTLDSWSKPPSGSGDTYPNKLRYIVPSEKDTPRGLTPGSYQVPSRSTSADFVARWMGSVSTDWGEIIHMRTPVELRPVRDGAGVQFQLVGTIQHALPARLEQVKVIVVTPRRRPLALIPANAKQPMPAVDRSGEMPLYGYFFGLSEWAPGVPLSLETIMSSAQEGGTPIQNGMLPNIGVGTTELSRAMARLYREPIGKTFVNFTGESQTSEARRRYLESLSLYSMLSPPEWLLRGSGSQVEAYRAEREHAREIDLSAWFTRPCIIVMGFLEDAPTPVPLTIDGDEVASEGTTMYRWILPLDGFGWEIDKRYQDMVVPDPRSDVGTSASASVPDAPTPPATEPTEENVDPATATTPSSPNPPRAVPAPGRRRPN